MIITVYNAIMYINILIRTVSSNLSENINMFFINDTYNFPLYLLSSLILLVVLLVTNISVIPDLIYITENVFMYSWINVSAPPVKNLEASQLYFFDTILRTKIDRILYTHLRIYNKMPDGL
jgi:hypothetical protein